MKLKHTLSLLSLATCAALSSSAFAQLTVTFKGEIVDSACGSVVANNGADVVLPQKSFSDFPAVGDKQGETPFDVKLENCKPANQTFAVNFSNPNANTDGYIENIGAAGFGYQLTNAGGLTIKFTDSVPQSTDPFQANTPTGTGTGPHTLSYKIWYRRLATTMGAGVTSATATMTVQYN